MLETQSSPSHQLPAEQQQEQQPGGDLCPQDSGQGPRAASRLWTRCRELAYENFIKPLVTSRNPPKYDARAVGLGLVIGFGIPVGGHFLSLALLRVAIRFNYLVAATFTFVCNPLNMVPLYYGYYLLGSTVLGRKSSMDMDAFEKLINPVLDKAYFWEALSAFAALGYEFLIRWVVAAVILAVVFGIPGYVITFKIQAERCKAAAKKLGTTYEQLLKDMECRGSAGTSGPS